MITTRHEPLAGAEPSGAVVRSTPQGRQVPRRDRNVRSLFAASLGARLAAAAVMLTLLWLATFWAIEAI